MGHFRKLDVLHIPFIRLSYFVKCCKIDERFRWRFKGETMPCGRALMPLKGVTVTDRLLGEKRADKYP